MTLSFSNLKRPLGAFLFLAAGLNHFYMPEFYEKLMPHLFPYPDFLHRASGVLEIVAGIGLLIPASRKAAAVLAVALLVLFLPLHVSHFFYKAQLPLLQAVPNWVLALRLAFQLLLIKWYWQLRH